MKGELRDHRLRSTLHLHRDGVVVADVRCNHPRGRGVAVTRVQAPAIVFVRRGCFVRSADGVERTHDPTAAYCVHAGEEERYDHPHDGGDDCTSIRLTPQTIAAICGGMEQLPRRLLPVCPQADLAHRLMLASTRRGDDPENVLEQALAVAASVLSWSSEHQRPLRPRAARTWTQLAQDARSVLANDLDLSLNDLSAALAVSPHHLSRVFRAQTGLTVARYRVRLRVREALERLEGGETDLGRLAVDVGFADHSHLCRAFRAELGRTPARVRSSLAGAVAASDLWALESATAGQGA